MFNIVTLRLQTLDVMLETKDEKEIRPKMI